LKPKRNELLREVQKNFGDKKTPFLVLSLKEIEKNYIRLKKEMPFAEIYYAVKANPHLDVLSLLDRKGANFDVATIYEFNDLLSIGVSPKKISFGNTIKKHEDIKYFYDKGVRLFATDSISDLKKIARNAPGSNVFFRLSVRGAGADWKLSKKFGAHSDMIIELAQEARKLKLIPYGLSFHVGSQQRDVEQWDEALSECRYIFEELDKKGIHLQMINLGGGLPSEYLVPTPSLSFYAIKIASYLKNHFGKKMPRILIEPGRYMAGSAGILATEVVLISKKSESMPYEWMYIDAGIYQGLDECMGEAIRYPIKTDCRSNNKIEFVICGPTCDSHDILYEKNRYKLPSNLREGSRLYFINTGAYTFQVSSVGFNGFPPLKVYILENEKIKKK